MISWIKILSKLNLGKFCSTFSVNIPFYLLEQCGLAAPCRDVTEVCTRTTCLPLKLYGPADRNITRRYDAYLDIWTLNTFLWQRSHNRVLLNQLKWKCTLKLLASEFGPIKMPLRRNYFFNFCFLAAVSLVFQPLFQFCHVNVWRERKQHSRWTSNHNNERSPLIRTK